MNKKSPYWLKGGVFGIILMSFLIFILCSPLFETSLFKEIFNSLSADSLSLTDFGLIPVCENLRCDFSVLFINVVLLTLTLEVLGFVIGFVIGLAIEKAKHKHKK